MISWINIKEQEPEINAWILVTYKFTRKSDGKEIWCKRIHQWTEDTHLKRKVTHWSPLNSPEEMEEG